MASLGMAAEVYATLPRAPEAEPKKYGKTKIFVDSFVTKPQYLAAELGSALLMGSQAGPHPNLQGRRLEEEI
jgi:hypothetical protein